MVFKPSFTCLEQTKITRNAPFVRNELRCKRAVPCTPSSTKKTAFYFFSRNDSMLTF